MAEQHSGEGSSTGGASVSNSDSTLELNIKTLDSRIYTFHVDKNMPVSSFKGKIAEQVGVPMVQQRLIFRGKVLKDEHLLSEYHVENGDTLHLVERQPAQPQTSSGTGYVDTSGNNGSQGTDAGVPRNRIGQISHSVVLGTFGVGDQGEGAVPDLTRVIGAVLNSLGVGGQPTTNGTNGVGVQAAATTNQSNAASRGNNTEQVPGSTGAPIQAPSPFGQPFFSQPLHVPMGTSVNPPSLNLPIPDSLRTLSEFISRMEEVLSRNDYQATPSATSLTDQAVADLPTNARGFPTPEALSVVLRQAERLLSGVAVTALSHIAGRLEQDGGSTDASVRSHIQSNSVQVGLAMQHLGALFLEIGRTMLMLRMGHSPAEAVVNSGPAVYISQSGPNPIMVQPFPHQTSPLFNPPTASAPNSGASIPVGIIGSAPRNINIHIHAGTAVPSMVSTVGTRGVPGEGAENERGGVAASSDSGAARVFPVRNVIATAIPSQTATIAVTPVTTGSQPVGGVATSQPPEAASIISEVNTFLENMRTGNQAPAGQLDSLNSSVGSTGAADSIDPSRRMHSEASGDISESHGPMPEQKPEDGVTNSLSRSSQSNDVSSSVVEPAPSCVTGELTESSDSTLKDLQTSGDSSRSSGVRDVPLGLGGGLQPKKRGQQSKKSSESGTSGSIDQSQQPRASGQQILQSLLSQSSSVRTSSDVSSAGQGIGQRSPAGLSDAEGSEGRLDVTGMMSEVLDSPALNGLLSGVAQQTGVGSPDMLRNMLQQFTQNPAMMNTVNQLAQQVDREDFRNMFAGAGAGQGSLDLSSMVQQMMPVVSQVLGGASFQNDQVQNLVPELPPQVNRSSLGYNNSVGQGIQQSDVEGVAQQIAALSSPQDVFRALVQSAMDLSGTLVELIEELCSHQELLDLFREVLRSDLLRRLSGGES